MKQWTIETLVAQLRATILDITGEDIMAGDNPDRTVGEMMDIFREEALRRGMPTISERKPVAEIPGQTVIPVEDRDAAIEALDEIKTAVTTSDKKKGGSL